jgi:phosphatidylserine synthase
MAVSESTDAVATQVRLLAVLLAVFAGVKIFAVALGYLSALTAAGGTDPDGSRTIYWIPQLLFYSLLLASSLRLRGFEKRSRTAVVSLCALSLAATAVYTLLDFTVGPGHEQPAIAIAIKLRLLVGGDIWDLIFPALAIVWLRKREARELFEVS